MNKQVIPSVTYHTESEFQLIILKPVASIW